MKPFLTAALLLALSLPAGAASTRTYGPFPSRGNAILARLPAGGLAVAVCGDPDSALMTLDANGKVVAARSLGAQRPAFLATSSGEIYLGTTGTVSRLRSDLSPMWTRGVGLLDGAESMIEAGAATADGGVVLAGMRDPAVIVVKLSRRGDAQWTTVVDASGFGERLRAIRQLPDRGFLAAGSRQGSAWIVRLRRDGELMWQRSYSPLRQFDACVLTRRGALVCVGDAGGKPAIARMDPVAGTPVWSKTVSTSGYGYAIVETAAGVVVAVSGRRTDVLAILAVDQDGKVLWQRELDAGAYRAMPFWDQPSTFLAPRGDRLALTPPFAEQVPVLELDPESGRSGCAWLASGAAALEDVRDVDAMELPVEVSAPGAVTRPGAIALTALAVTSGTEQCVVTAGPVDPEPSSKAVAFRSRDDSAAEQRYTALVQAKDVAGLEETADRLRTERPSPDPMRPNLALYTFYRVLASDATAPEEARLALLRQWVEARPQSFSARIALANALYGAARKRRGRGEWSQVTATGAAGFTKLMNEGRQVLSAEGADAQADPQYWRVRIAFAGEIGGEDVRDLARRGLAIHADPDIAASAALYLQPQWGGSAEELRAFAGEAARLTREKYGDAVYMWLAYDADDGAEQPYGFDWERVQKGFEDAIRLAPQWLPTYHRYAHYAHGRKDRAKARELFGREELAWYEDAERVWGDRQVYESARERALEIVKP